MIAFAAMCFPILLSNLPEQRKKQKKPYLTSQNWWKCLKARVASEPWFSSASLLTAKLSAFVLQTVLHLNSVSSTTGTRAMEGLLVLPRRWALVTEQRYANLLCRGVCKLPQRICFISDHGLHWIVLLCALSPTTKTGSEEARDKYDSYCYRVSPGYYGLTCTHCLS